MLCQLAVTTLEQGGDNNHAAQRLLVSPYLPQCTYSPAFDLALGTSSPLLESANFILHLQRCTFQTSQFYQSLDVQNMGLRSDELLMRSKRKT